MKKSNTRHITPKKRPSIRTVGFLLSLALLAATAYTVALLATIPKASSSIAKMEPNAPTTQSSRPNQSASVPSIKEENSNRPENEQKNDSLINKNIPLSDSVPQKTTPPTQSPTSSKISRQPTSQAPQTSKPTKVSSTPSKTESHPTQQTGNSTNQNERQQKITILERNQRGLNVLGVQTNI